MSTHSRRAQAAQECRAYLLLLRLPSQQRTSCACEASVPSPPPFLAEDRGKRASGYLCVPPTRRPRAEIATSPPGRLTTAAPAILGKGPSRVCARGPPPGRSAARRRDDGRERWRAGDDERPWQHWRVRPNGISLIVGRLGGRLGGREGRRACAPGTLRCNHTGAGDVLYIASTVRRVGRSSKVGADACRAARRWMTRLEELAG